MVGVQGWLGRGGGGPGVDELGWWESRGGGLGVGVQGVGV